MRTQSLTHSLAVIVVVIALLLLFHNHVELADAIASDQSILVVCGAAALGVKRLINFGQWPI
jgi:hypothetical protein